MKDKVFFFGSAERILESRDLNFMFNPNLPASLMAFETPFNKHSMTYDTRARFKLDENWDASAHRADELHEHARHGLSSADSFHQSAGHTGKSRWSNAHARPDRPLDARRRANSWVMNSYFHYRADPERTSPSHPESGVPNNLFNLFDTYTSGSEFGNLGQTSFGPGYNAFSFYQKYVSVGTNLTRQYGRHNIKFGWDYQNQRVDGDEPNNFFTQLFATIDDFNTFGPINSGINLITLQAGATPAIQPGPHPQQLQRSLRSG